MCIDPDVTVAATSLDEDSPTPAAIEARGPASVLSRSTAARAEPDTVAPNAHLEHVRALIARGDYTVDLDKLASRIVDDEALRGGK